MCRSGARVTSESRGVPGGSTNSARATTLFTPQAAALKRRMTIGDAAADSLRK